jgi:hypothetical protein
MNSDEDGGRWSPIDTDEWYATRNATTALRDVLTTAGMARAFPRLRAELNAFGQGLIELGRVSPETAEHPRFTSSGRWRYPPCMAVPDGCWHVQGKPPTPIRRHPRPLIGAGGPGVRRARDRGVLRAGVAGQHPGPRPLRGHGSCARAR